MPKSKRSRIVALTKTERRTNREHKSGFIQQVRDAVDEHDRLYLFSYENMRSSKFKDVRMYFRSSTNNKKSKDQTMMDDDDASEDDDAMETTTTTKGQQEPSSRIFMGKNKLMQIALGRVPEEEYSDNVRHVAKLITGPTVGLLFTSRSRRDVESFFAGLAEPDFCKAGFISPRTIAVDNKMLSSFPVSMLEQLRTNGLVNTKVKEGKIVLSVDEDEIRLCKEGEKLSAEKCKLLLQFGIKLAEFKVDLVCCWEKDGGEFEML